MGKQKNKKKQRSLLKPTVPDKSQLLLAIRVAIKIQIRSRNLYNFFFLLLRKCRLFLQQPYCFQVCGKEKKKKQKKQIIVLLLLVDVVTKVTSLAACNLRIQFPVLLAPFLGSKAHAVRWSLVGAYSPQHSKHKMVNQGLWKNQYCSSGSEEKVLN